MESPSSIKACTNFAASAPNGSTRYCPPGVINREAQWVRPNLRRCSASPLPSSALAGRDDELARLVQILRAARLVTLLRPGGVGKARLSIEVARLVSDDFDDGVWIVGPDTISDPDAVGHNMLGELSIRPKPGREPLDALVASLQDRRVLIVADNCEHLVSTVAPLLRALLDRCPHLTVLATSRIPLGVPGEQICPVSPLSTDDAVQLFTNRALKADPGFSAIDTRSSIDTLCRRLDRMPLAIELAAARVRALSPAELLSRLDVQFRLLRAPTSAATTDGDQRHRALVNTIDWSHQLLDETSRTSFARLCVFAGSFDLDAAVAVCRDDDLDDGDEIDAVTTLVDHSMITTTRVAEHNSYRLLETIRAFGLDRLQALGLHDEARRRHGRWIADYTAGLLGGLLAADSEVAMQSANALDACWVEIRTISTSSSSIATP